MICSFFCGTGHGGGAYRVGGAKICFWPSWAQPREDDENQMFESVAAWHRLA
jgi:hypothetical protein